MKVIYSNFSDERQLIIEELYQTRNWDPITVMAPARMEKWVQKNFSKAMYIDPLKLRKSIFPSVVNDWDIVPLDEQVLTSLAQYESTCLDIINVDTTTRVGSDHSMARYSYQPQLDGLEGNRRRKQFYYQMLTFWNTLLNNTKPDLFVCFMWPHIITDYSLYRLCRHYRVPTLFMDPTPILDDLFLVQPTLEDLAYPIRKPYNSSAVYTLSSNVKNYLERTKMIEGTTQPHITGFYEKWGDQNRSHVEKFRSRFSTLANWLRYLSKNRDKLKNRETIINGIRSWNDENKLQKRKANIFRQNRRLRKIYSKYITPIDLHRDYLYFPAGYQPEATTLPNCGVYSDFFLILSIVSHSIPDGWLIYFKEHPNTFLSRMRGSMYRDNKYYDRVLSFGNVRIISESESTFRLIDHAKAVITPGGSAGWEAVVRGVPALLFGHIWYEACSSVFQIKTYSDCIDAIKKIKAGFTPNYADVERYAWAAEKASVEGMNYAWEFYDAIKQEDAKSEMHKVAEAFAHSYCDHYGASSQNDLQLNRGSLEAS